MEYQNYKIVYRRYASLFFIVGVDLFENELGILEFIHSLVETFDTYFKNVVCFNFWMDCLASSDLVIKKKNT